MNVMHAELKKHSSHFYFRAMALAAACVAVAGFARTYYLKELTGAASVPLLVHIHAVLFSSWILFFFVQTTLVANHRTDLHRKLGIFGVLLAVAMISEGYVAALYSVRRGFMGQFPNEPTGFVNPIAFFSLAIGDLVTFSVLIGLALWFRRRTDVHKRLMVLGTISLLGAALPRLPFGPARLPVAVASFVCLLAAGPVHDRKTLGRVHPVFIWGTLFVFLSAAVRPLIGNSAAWHSFASWLIR